MDEVTFVPAALPARSAAGGSHATFTSRDGAAVLLLAGWVAVTRLMVAGAFPGEPDSALFPIGLWRWVSSGPLSTRIYDRGFSPGYYWLAAHVAKWAHVGPVGYLPLLNAISLLAALASAPLAYALARTLLPPTEAFWSTLLWLLSPAVWWLGIEPHPQALGITLTLAAVLAHAHWATHRVPAPRAELWWASFACLTAALLVRSDAVFVYGAFFLPWLAHGSKPGRKALGETAALLAAASAAFLLLRAAILGSWSAAAAGERGEWGTIAAYISQLSLPHQALPFLTAAGLAATLLAGVGLLAVAAPERRRWLLVLALWSLPGTVFWLLIRGNTVRHVALYTLPLLWAGAAGWRRWRRPALLRRGNSVAWVAVLALALDVCLPASPNTTLYPSGDVPAGVAALRVQERALFALGRELATVPAGACYLGSYTSPYVLWGTLRGLDSIGGVRLLAQDPVTRLWLPPAPGPLVFHDVYSAEEFRRAARGCRQAISREYTAAGVRLHPMALAWLYPAPPTAP